MTYLITLYRRINTNVGDTLLVYIGQEEDKFEEMKIYICNIFIANGTFRKSQDYARDEVIECIIEYDFLKEVK